MNNTPGTGEQRQPVRPRAQAGAAGGTNPPGSGVRAGASGAAAVTGPAPRKQGDIGEKGGAASLRARPRARQTRAVRTGIAKAQSRLPADLSARLPPLLRNLQQRVAQCSCEVNYNESLSGIREEEDFS